MKEKTAKKQIPKCVKEGLITQKQWDSLTKNQRKHFYRTWERAESIGIDYWEYIKMKKEEKISQRLDQIDTRKYDDNFIETIRNGYVNKISTAKLAEKLNISDDNLRAIAARYGIRREDYKVKFTRVKFNYPKQNWESVLNKNRKDKKRFYVYAYVSTNGTPYYIGKGQLDRAFQPHLRPNPKGKGKCNSTPRDPNRIRLLDSDLNENQSFQLEEDLISILVTKELGTGCLLNFTSGGDGLRDPTPQTRQRISESAKLRGMPDNIHERKREISFKKTCDLYQISLEDYKKNET